MLTINKYVLLFFISLSTTISYTLNDSIRFLQIGDWGGKNKPPHNSTYQQRCANGMNNIASNISAQFIMGTGDNFYNFGVENVNDKRFDITWKQVYGRGLYLRELSWYQIAGNHDHDGNITAQLMYSHIDSKWIFPALYYKRRFLSNDQTLSIDVLFIDTIKLTNVRSGKIYPLDIQDMKQYEWIDVQLSESTADYLIVNGHYPVYSPCVYGNIDTLVNHLKPLLDKYNAHYFSGHEHCLAHMIVNGTNYWLNGLGRDCCYSQFNVDSIPKNGLKYILANPSPVNLKNGIGNTVSGFSSIIATKEKMAVRFHNQDGEILHESFVKPRSSSYSSQYYVCPNIVTDSKSCDVASGVIT